MHFVLKASHQSRSVHWGLGNMKNVDGNFELAKTGFMSVSSMKWALTPIDSLFTVFLLTLIDS